MILFTREAHKRAPGTCTAVSAPVYTVATKLWRQIQKQMSTLLLCALHTLPLVMNSWYGTKLLVSAIPLVLWSFVQSITNTVFRTHCIRLNFSVSHAHLMVKLVAKHHIFMKCWVGFWSEFIITGVSHNTSCLTIPAYIYSVLLLCPASTIHYWAHTCTHLLLTRVGETTGKIQILQLQ